MPDLPCDSDGVCMVCKIVPPDQDVLLCGSCSSPWHMACLCPPLQSVPLGDWSCPDCSLSPDFSSSSISNPVEKSGDHLVGKIRAVQSDSSLSEQQKARRCQELMSNAGKEDANALDCGNKPKDSKDSMLDLLDENLNCIFCMQIAERPITTPCGHNFCLRCFQRWIGQGKKNCGKCRANIPAKFASQPRINSALVMAIRMVKAAAATGGNKTAAPKPIHYINNQNRPDKAFMTERAKLPGKANACSGKIFVTTPSDFFGPITAEYDPERNQGVLVGESWADRMECRQWGTHLPHVAGIAGQSDYGAQSVALSGGYEDDEDHGEWFIYTGSGGRDLSGNKRTNKLQSSDQKFELMNEALRVSCKKGYPVRVVRSYKEKRSSYAPAEGVRYDGVYRIEKCWRKQGIQGFKVCRYLFVRCDNEPAPWTSDEHGDLIRPLPTVEELKFASDITERKGPPAWDWNDCKWCWVKPPPCTRKREDGKPVKRGERKQLSIQQKLLKEFGCGLCKNVLKLPLSTPCGHNFCKSCLELQFAGQKDVCERARVGGRALRARKVLKHCPTCGHDITDFVFNPQVNRQMQSVIQSLKESDANEFPDDSPMPSTDESTQKTIEGSTDEKGPKEDVVICNVDDVKCNVQNEKFERSPDGKEPKEDVVVCNLQNEKLFKELCCKYTDYSEDLLLAMLADQDGDLEELSALLRKLQSQTTQTQKKRPRQSQDTETRHSKRH